MAKASRYLSLIPIILSILACNLVSAPAAQPTATPVVTSDTVPSVSVRWPANQSEFAVREEVTVHASATDDIGITRIELRSESAVLASVPSPLRSGETDFEAILSWRPSRAGVQNLEVVAYRRRVPSVPVPLTLIIHQRARDIVATPLPLGFAAPAAPPQASVACQVRVDIGNLRYRSGPGTGYDILGILDLGETLFITGKNAAGTWWQAERNGQRVWVSATSSYSTELSSCAAAPVAESPN